MVGAVKNIVLGALFLVSGINMLKLYDISVDSYNAWWIPAYSLIFMLLLHGARRLVSAIGPFNKIPRSRYIVAISLFLFAITTPQIVLHSAREVIPSLILLHLTGYLIAVALLDTPNIGKRLFHT